MYPGKARDKVLDAKIWNNNSVSNFTSSKLLNFIWMEKYVKTQWGCHQHLQMHKFQKIAEIGQICQTRQEVVSDSHSFKIIK